MLYTVRVVKKWEIDINKLGFYLQLRVAFFIKYHNYLAKTLEFRIGIVYEKIGIIVRCLLWAGGLFFHQFLASCDSLLDKY